MIFDVGFFFITLVLKLGDDVWLFLEFCEDCELVNSVVPTSLDLLFELLKFC